MKRLFIVLISLSLLLSACQKKADEPITIDVTPSPAPTATPSPTPVPTPELTLPFETKNVSLLSGVISMSIPENSSSDFGIQGNLYNATVVLENEAGEKAACEWFVTHVFQAEEPLMDYDMFRDYCDYMVMNNGGLDFSSTYIEDIVFSDTATGFYKLYTFTRAETKYDRHVLFIASDGVYYEVNLICPADFISTEVVSKLFATVEIDAEKEADWVSSFEIKIEDGYYYSATLDGAKILLSDNYTYTEGSRLGFKNQIIGLTLNSNFGYMNVQVFPKSSYSFESCEDFSLTSYSNLVHRGLITEENYNDAEQYLTEAGHVYSIIPANNGSFYMMFTYEYTDAYYSIELRYFGVDFDELAEFAYAAMSFSAPGENITPVFE